MEPFDYTTLDEIILFKGNQDTIILSREGKYINLIKPEEQDKKYYRYDLNEKKFQRINHYKTVPDKTTDVKIKNITSWFKDSQIITKDLHFGRLILYAKFHVKFEKYSSPVRFIAQLGHDLIIATEQWEALGFKIKELEEFFGEKLAGDTYDERKTIYQGETHINQPNWKRQIRTHGGITIPPSKLSKELLNHIKKTYTTIDNNLITTLHKEYNNGEYHIEKKLKKITQNPEYYGIFHYHTEYRQYGQTTTKQKWTFGPSHESKRIKYNLIQTIQTYNLDIPTLCKWIKKQKNSEKNDVGYLFGYGNHYYDYLRCEYELNDGRLSKMDKYPDNFRTQFHRTQEEYNSKKAEIDEKKFKQESIKHQNLEHTGRKYIIKIPKTPQEIHLEAQELKHCVRTYIPRVVNGETLILFLRDKKHPNTPLITLEVKKGALTQAYGKNDRKPKKEHLQFLKIWAKNKNLKIGCWKTDLT